MRVLSLFISLLSTVPCFAGRTVSPIDVTKSLDFADMCKQRHVLHQFPDAIKKDGLSHKLEKGSEDLMSSPRHPNFQDTPEQLDQALVNEFVRNKKHAMQTALGMGCIHYGCDFLTIIGTAFATGLNQVAGAFAIAKGATTTKEAVETGVREGFRIAHMENDVRFRYECEYVKKRRFLPKDLRKAIEFKLSATYQCDETNLIPTLETISKVLNIPTKSQLPKMGFKKEITRLAEGYTLEDQSTTLAEILENICTTHHTTFTEKAGPNCKSREMTLFQGDPGIGKSYISAALGKVLGLPVIRVLLQDPKSFMGDATNPGTLLLALCREGLPRNAIILIDEVDQALSEGSNGIKETDKKVKIKTSPTSATANWLDFFDPDKKTMFFPYLNTEVDISHYLILMTCNGDIQQSALKDRIPMIRISGLTENRLLEIVEQNIVPKLLKSENPALNIPMNEFSNSGINVQQIVKAAKSKSIRPIERELSKQINKVLRLGRLEKNSGKEEVTSPEFESMIPPYFGDIEAPVMRNLRKKTE